MGFEEHDHVPKKVVPVACLGVLYHFNKATLDAKSLRSMKDAQSTKLKFYHTAEGATAAATERQALLGRARARRRNGSNGPSRVGEALRALFPLVFGKPRRRGREGHSQGKGGRSFQTQSRAQVSTIPLSVAFKLARRFPSYYEIACDEEERKAARRVVRERRGEAEATKLLDGGPDRRPSVPLFSVPGVRVVLKTEEGSVSYKPMFLSLSQLEQTWALARGILSRTLAAKRGHERRMAVSKVVKAAAAVAGIPPSPPSQERGDDEAEEPADAGDDLDPAADLGDPPEIKEFLEELGEGRGAGGAHHGGQGAGGPVSPLVLLNRIAGSIACSATALVGQCVCSAGDAADQILLDRAWGWRVLGMDPRANVEATTLTEVLTRVGEREAGGCGGARQEARQEARAEVVEAEMEIRSEEGEPDGSEDSEGRSLVGQASALPFQVVDTTAGAEADGVGPMGSVPPTMESSDEEGGPVNLQGTVECFLDWTRATRAAGKKSESAPEADLGVDGTGLLLVGSVGFQKGPQGPRRGAGKIL